MLHAKTLKVGDYFIGGSTNWTVSSRANHECSLVIKLNSEGIKSVEEWIEYLDRESEDAQNVIAQDVHEDEPIPDASSVIIEPSRGRNSKRTGSRTRAAG